jgi:hypothetical protein
VAVARDRRPSVVNGGIPGNQTHEYIERFQRDVVELDPCGVVISGIDNDVIRARRYARPDGSHLTAAGYRVIDHYVIPRLRVWFGRPEPSLTTGPLARAAGG